jgi:hypothetical protein
MGVEDAEEVPEVMTVDITALDLTEAISEEIWVIKIRGPLEIRAVVVTVVEIEDPSTKQNEFDRKDSPINDVILKDIGTPVS